ncbi:MAG: hypothetical protein JXJ18_04245 [Rhodobacteraceae bacterium]|nr:hypothetical protein [Paracoccaceae bacterium]
MSDCPTLVAATLLFTDRQELVPADLINEFSRTLRNIGLDCPKVEGGTSPSITLSNDHMQLSVAMGETIVTAELLRGVQRPVMPRSTAAAVEQILQACDSAITVTARCTDTAADKGIVVPERVLVAACYHIVRLLDRELEAALIHWQATDTLFTAEEFDAPLLPSDPSLSANPPLNRIGREGVIEINRDQSGFDQAVTRLSVVESDAQSVETIDVVPETAAAPPRTPPVRKATARQRPLTRMAASGLRQVRRLKAVATSEPKATPLQADAAPKPAARPTPLTPEQAEARYAAASEEALRKARMAIFASDLIETEDRKRPKPRPEPGLAEQLTVYVMSMTLMVLSFPVGFGVLIFNIIAGENLRNTARAMALTGVGFAVNGTDIAQRLADLI